MTGIEIAMVAMAAVSAVSMIAAGQQAADANEANAATARAQGDAVRQQADAAAGLQDRINRRNMAQTRANFAASGIDPDGSPLDVMQDQTQEGELQKAFIRYKGSLGQWSADAQAQQYTRAAGAAQTASYFGAAQSLLGGAFMASGGYSASSPAVNSGAAQVPAAMTNISTGVSTTSPY